MAAAMAVPVAAKMMGKDEMVVVILISDGGYGGGDGGGDGGGSGVVEEAMAIWRRAPKRHVWGRAGRSVEGCRSAVAGSPATWGEMYD